MRGLNDVEHNKKYLSEYCRTIRVSNGLTVEDFANQCGVSRQTISNFENGKHLSLDIFLKYYALSFEIKGVHHDNKSNS